MTDAVRMLEPNIPVQAASLNQPRKKVVAKKAARTKSSKPAAKTRQKKPAATRKPVSKKVKY